MPVRKETHYVGKVCPRLSVYVLTSVITQGGTVPGNNDDDQIEPLPPLTSHRYPTRDRTCSAASITLQFPASGLSMNVSSPGPKEHGGKTGVHLFFSKMSPSSKSLPMRGKAQGSRDETKRGAKGKKPVTRDVPAQNPEPEGSRRNNRRSRPADLVQQLIAELPEGAHIVSFMSPFGNCAAMCQTERTTLL